MPFPVNSIEKTIMKNRKDMHTTLLLAIITAACAPVTRQLATACTSPGCLPGENAEDALARFHNAASREFGYNRPSRGADYLFDATRVALDSGICNAVSLAVMDEMRQLGLTVQRFPDRWPHSTPPLFSSAF